MKIKFAFVAAVAVILSVSGVTTFSPAAESVWPAGLEQEMNTLVGFSAAFDQKAGEKAVLKLVA